MLVSPKALISRLSGQMKTRVTSPVPRGEDLPRGTRDLLERAARNARSDGHHGWRPPVAPSAGVSGRVDPSPPAVVRRMAMARPESLVKWTGSGIR